MNLESCRGYRCGNRVILPEFRVYAEVESEG